jgi:hypothetical protein
MIIYLSVGDPWSDKKSYESINLLTERVVTGSRMNDLERASCYDYFYADGNAVALEWVTPKWT